MTFPTIQTPADARSLVAYAPPEMPMACPSCGIVQHWTPPLDRRLAVGAEPPGWAYVRCRYGACRSTHMLVMRAWPGLPCPPALVPLEPPPPDRMVEVRLKSRPPKSSVSKEGVVEQGREEAEARWRPALVTRQTGSRIWCVVFLDESDSDYTSAALGTTAERGGEPGCWRPAEGGQRMPPHTIQVVVPGGAGTPRRRPMVVTSESGPVSIARGMIFWDGVGPTDRAGTVSVPIARGMIFWDAVEDTDRTEPVSAVEAARGPDGVWRLVVRP